MGNIIQALSGKNKKMNIIDDNNEQLQLFKANPVLTMFLKFVENLGHQVQLFRAKHDFTNVSKYVEKVEQHAQQLYENYVFPVYCRYVESLPLEPQVVERNGTKSLVLYQAYALGGLFVLKWAWERWIQPGDDDSSTDPS